MNVTRGVLALVLVLGLGGNAIAKPKAIPVVVDASTGTITVCGDSKDGPCFVSAHEGAVVSVTVDNALPGLFSYTTTPHERPVTLVSADLAKSLGLAAPEPAAKEPAQGAAPPPGMADTPQSLYSAVVKARQELLATVNGAYGKESYAKARNGLIAARQAFLIRLGAPDETSAVAAALSAVVIGPLPADAEARAAAIGRRDALIAEVTATWNDVRALLATAPAAPTSLGPYLVTFREGEVDIVIEVAATTANPTGVTRLIAIPVREKQGWGWSTSTGFAVSGLTDHNFSVRTITVTPATATEKAVTRREMVGESSDRLRVQPALFLHLYPFGGGWERLALTTGASLSPSSSAQIYAGASLRLGRIGTITAGVACGNVKRQSLNVDPKDLGDLDPQQSRRDQFMTRPFIAITARFAGGH